MGNVKTYNPRAIIISIGGFLLGFFFGNELMGWAQAGLGWLRGNAMPTVYEIFGEMGGVAGMALAGLAILITIAMIKRWNLLIMVEWIVIGFLCGLVVPLIWPMIADRLPELTLPF